MKVSSFFGADFAIEVDGGIEVYLDGGGVVVLHLSHFLEVLLGMGGVGQYLVIAAVDIDVYRGLFFCHFHRIFMVVRHGVVWTYVQRVYGRTALGGKDVRAKGAWTYVHRCFERA